MFFLFVFVCLEVVFCVCCYNYFGFYLGKFDHCLVNTWVTELKKQRVRLRTDPNGIHHDKTNLNLNA